MSLLLNNPISRSFYSHFPHLRRTYVETHYLNETLQKLEEVAFAAFPSFRKTENAPALLAERLRIIQNIQESTFSGSTIAVWLRFADMKLAEAKKTFLFPHERREIDLLQQQTLALKYRSGALSKGYDREAGAALAAQIEPIIRAYVSHPKMFPGRHEATVGAELSHLTQAEKESLVHACTRYPELFNTFLERHIGKKGAVDEWTANFVKWCIRSRCSPGVFVKVPMERDALSRVHLDKRSGSVDGKKGICFSDFGVYGCFHRTLCIRIDERLEPIQGDFKNREVTLKNLVNPGSAGITLRIKDILRIFKEKTAGYGPVEYLSGGVRNWDAIALGSHNGRTKKVDTVSVEHILTDLKTKAPFVQLSSAEMQERYSLTAPPQMEDGQWGLALRASRMKPNLNILEAHGYAEIVCRDGDSYYLFPMGVQPIVLPQTDIGKLLYLTATNKGGLHTPDESFFLRQRQQAGILFPLSEAETVRLKYGVSSMYKKSQDGHLLFQFGGTNCSFHMQRLFDQVIGAPFYDKVREISDRAFSRSNIIVGTLDRMNYRKAFEGLNHDLLDSILGKLVDHLWKEKNIRELQELARLSHQLLCRAYQEEIPFVLDRISLSNPDCRQLLKSLVFETIEAARFYRMDLFKIETDQGLLASFNKLIQLAPWRWMKKIIVNTILFLFGSWRWVAVRRNREPSANSSVNSTTLEISAMAANPLVQEGYLNHPAALWEWIKSKEDRVAKVRELLSPTIASS